MGLVHAGCVVEVFNLREVVVWCAERFDLQHIVIKVKEEVNSIYLVTPITNFEKSIEVARAGQGNMLDAYAFIDTKAGGFYMWNK